MSQPYIGEIRCFGFNFAPQGWAFCNGQLMAISQNDTLFNLIGTTYGGDGQATFALPNLQGRIPMHIGTSPGGLQTVIGQNLGAPNASLTVQNLPSHSHGIQSALVAPGGVAEHTATPTGSAYIGPSGPDQAYNTAPTLDTLFSPLAIGSTGASVPHENMQPYLTVSFCISLFGIFPSQS